MSEERFLELAPLAALGALDGEDRVAFEQHVRTSVVCRAELEAFASVAARIPLALDPVPPPARMRQSVLAAIGVPAAEPAVAPRRGWLLPGFAAAAALLLGIGYLITRSERDAARREAENARTTVSSLAADVQRAQDELAALRKSLADERSVRDLVTHPDARVAKLAGLPFAPKATGRVVWNPTSREAVLVASGLDPAPAGKTYEVWVIAQAAPVPAGVFQVAADGSAVFRLPVVEDTAHAKTFAVTLEPAGGTPAPTGPMVLAGAAS